MSDKSRGEGRKEPMVQKAVRLPQALTSRATALAERLKASPFGEAVRWNETSILRLAVSEGLKVLEANAVGRVAATDPLDRLGADAAAVFRPGVSVQVVEVDARGRGIASTHFKITGVDVSRNAVTARRIFDWTGIPRGDEGPKAPQASSPEGDRVKAPRRADDETQRIELPPGFRPDTGGE